MVYYLGSSLTVEYIARLVRTTLCVVRKIENVKPGIIRIYITYLPAIIWCIKIYVYDKQEKKNETVLTLW